jgi:hypothetical protein
MAGKYVAPGFKLNAFHCPNCETYAHQTWYSASKVDANGNVSFISDLLVSSCSRCLKSSFWLNQKLVFPLSSVAPLPEEDMPENSKVDYIEAREIVNASPRAACALLRLSLQKLMVSLGEEGENLNKDIGNLVRKGLPKGIQQALDCVRVIGNNAVHPAELDLKDDSQTALSLFELLNMIVTYMITQPKEISKLYERLPQGAKAAIEKRGA